MWTHTKKFICTLPPFCKYLFSLQKRTRIITILYELYKFGGSNNSPCFDFNGLSTVKVSGTKNPSIGMAHLQKSRKLMWICVLFQFKLSASILSQYKPHVSNIIIIMDKVALNTRSGS